MILDSMIGSNATSTTFDEKQIVAMNKASDSCSCKVKLADSPEHSTAKLCLGTANIRNTDGKDVTATCEKKNWELYHKTRSSIALCFCNNLFELS